MAHLMHCVILIAELGCIQVTHPDKISKKQPNLQRDTRGEHFR